MWTLAKTCAIVAMSVVAAGNVMAVDLPEPFVALAVQSKPLYLGEAWGPGLKQMGAQLNARVLANCPYRLEASFQGLRHRQGKAVISPRDMSVAINGEPVAVGGGRTTVVSSYEPTPSGGVDVAIALQVGVRGLELYPAGRYGGALVITVMAGP